MPLETCMILLDRSEYMRNGDYVPNRLQAQRDAANMLTNVKQSSHPESTVGVAAGYQVLASPTRQLGVLLAAIQDTDYTNQEPALAAAVQVASLALKYRTNKHGGQRIVVFCGTPIPDTEKQLTKVGKLLKKNNISISVVLLGQLDQNTAPAQVLVDAANSGDCHVIPVPAGVLPSDVLAESPVCAADGGVHMAAAVSGSGGDNFGGMVDPNMDPELAMALRVSMEEERARQERAAETTTEAPLSEEDALLQQALAMSMNDDAEGAAAEPPAPPAEMDEDAAMQMALQMSMQQEQQEEKEDDKKEE